MLGWVIPSGTGFVTPPLTFKVSKVIEASKRFGRGYKPPTGIGFHADNVLEPRLALEEAVDDYLETCAKVGKSPEKPANVKLLLRIPPEIHVAAIIKAKSVGKGLNQWATDVLGEAPHT